MSWSDILAAEQASETSRTVCQEGLPIHPAIACCAAVDANRILKAGEVAVG